MPRTPKPKPTRTKKIVVKKSPEEMKPSAKPISSYDHKLAERVNNPPVGLVHADNDPDLAVGQKKYKYDPHLDPELCWDQQIGRKEIEEHFGRVRALTSAAESALRKFNQVQREGAVQEVEKLRKEAETLCSEARMAASALEKLQNPYLQWAGKAEHTSFEVPTVSLHVHERIDPRTIVEAVRRKGTNAIQYEQLSLFHSARENPPIREAIEFYKHRHNWSNRLIAGDSLLVMNSLLEKEGMAGQVQMVYIDPPYGIKYGSNFQPFVNKRDVKDGKDEDLTQEPEMVKAFRDTWELGIHSYLAYLRDRLLLAKELLTESGSVFVQISEENLHLIRNLTDEVFGKENFVGQIIFQKSSGRVSDKLDAVYDVLVWYAKKIDSMKFRKLYRDRTQEQVNTAYTYIELPDKSVRMLTQEEIEGGKPIPDGARRFRPSQMYSQTGGESSRFSFEFDGRIYSAPKTGGWRTSRDGVARLAEMNRVLPRGQYLAYKMFSDDFPYVQLHNIWTDVLFTSFGTQKLYIVETSTKVVQRCLMMTTDPGDVVLDPTCGSGTTAFVAEQWGRRWITCDTSRVSITLAKQRLMTALFDYYDLARPDEGVDSGFRYKTVPHVTLKSIANNEPADQETLYDQPFVDNARARVTGPFTVEAVPAPSVAPLDALTPSLSRSQDQRTGEGDANADASIARSGETLRQAQWRDELLRTGIRGKGGQKIEFTRVEPLLGTRYLHADAETREAKSQRVVVSFSSAYAPLEQRQVERATEEAHDLVPKPKLVVFAAFQFDPEAAKDIEETIWPGLTLLKVQMNTDLLTDDLKKNRTSNESFWLIGQPDVTLDAINTGADKGKYRVAVHGFDYYNTKTGNIESGSIAQIAIWLLDPDYDGRSLFPRQVFFPLAGDKEGWAKLARNLKTEIDEELIEAYRGTESLPFDLGKNKRVAVKIIDDRGIESLKVIEVGRGT